MIALRDATLFLSGMLAAGYGVAAVYFLKFWRQTGDRLFGFFTAAFGLLFVQRVALTLGRDLVSDTTWLYGLRLVAFGLILAAIVDKNRGTE